MNAHDAAIDDINEVHEVHEVHKYTSLGACMGQAMKGVPPKRSAMIRRLAAAGCPISYRDLLSTEYPLRLSELMPAMATNIVPLSSGATGIALRLRIFATSDITIGGFELRKRNWASFPIDWTQFCEEHRAFCFHDGINRAEVAAGDTLNFRILQPGLGGVLKRSTSIEGYLLGTIPERR